MRNDDEVVDELLWPMHVNGRAPQGDAVCAYPTDHAMHIGTREVQSQGNLGDGLRWDPAQLILHIVQHRQERPEPPCMGSQDTVDGERVL